MAAPVDLSDPAWFLRDYRPEQDGFVFSHVALENLTRPAFLDQRMGLDAEAVQIAAADVLDATRPAATPGLLFHTAFCGSTLLSRALEAPPRAVSLKEPLVLHALARVQLAGRWNAAAQDRLRAALALLARPWAPGGRVLVKPANQANGLLPQILAAAPQAPAVLLYSDLREFLVSCLKKGPEAEVPIRWMAQALLPFTRLPARLGIDPRAPFNLIEACVLAWYAQMELYAQALEHDHADRLRTLDFATVLAAPVPTVERCARWLGLGSEGVGARVASTFGRESKSQTPYDPTQRAAEREQVLQAHGALVERALAWAEAVVQPAAITPRVWKPLTAPA